MRVKFTNCKYYTGGGKRDDAVPRRIRINQNVRWYIPDIVLKWTDNQIKWYFEQQCGYRYLTSSTTKVIRNPSANYENRYRRLTLKLKKAELV